MKKQNLCLGMLVMVLAFGMAVVGCGGGGGGGDSSPSVLLGIHSEDWDSTTPTIGEAKLRFAADVFGEGITPSDLSWVTVDKFELYFSGDGDRTASITSVVLEPYNSWNVDAKLKLTRSAVPEGSARRHATVYLTIPSDFESEWDVEWDNSKNGFYF